MKKEILKLRDDLYINTKLQREGAWKEKNFKRSCEIRKKQKENFEKWRLLNGIIKEMEKEENENK